MAPMTAVAVMGRNQIAFLPLANYIGKIKFSAIINSFYFRCLRCFRADHSVCLIRETQKRCGKSREEEEFVDSCFHRFPLCS